MHDDASQVYIAIMATKCRRQFRSVVISQSSYKILGCPRNKMVFQGPLKKIALNVCICYVLKEIAEFLSARVSFCTNL